MWTKALRTTTSTPVHPLVDIKNNGLTHANTHTLMLHTSMPSKTQWAHSAFFVHSRQQEEGCLSYLILKQQGVSDEDEWCLDVQHCF